MKSLKKPYVILSAAMSIDGKIASKMGDPELSDEEDWKEVHQLRAQVDAILVGKNTILKDDPKLHIKNHKHEGYFRVVMDSSLSIPLTSKIIEFEIQMYPTVICTTYNIPLEKIERYRAKGVKVIQAGEGEKVDLKLALSQLYKLGIKKILLEGGGTLNWSFFESELIDEIRLTMAPWIVGGKEAISLVEGKGYEKMKDCPRYQLASVKNRDNYVIIKYKKRN